MGKEGGVALPVARRRASREGEAPAEPKLARKTRLGGSLALPSIAMCNHPVLGPTLFAFSFVSSWLRGK